ncbi:hypothetical protein LV779_15880 [Streptomyces thinghirensis]|nr:hypothetical protein [Streptomyces thinghirensis]
MMTFYYSLTRVRHRRSHLHRPGHLHAVLQDADFGLLPQHRLRHHRHRRHAHLLLGLFPAALLFDYIGKEARRRHRRHLPLRSPTLPQVIPSPSPA